ncbi:MAG: hypothetical protein NXY57DRAFT_1056245 [Lentinula lateritia]|uniref:Senescence domain-containing protein n=1 Tax=Lentinula lateritia TaxID=40482 RepID=A0ABQ8V7I5_9AGAR|nr:MAG: hypothetical protein NXY57DRAFT_1056245 [Lentinula lateritia]KAJ4478569.1 hypothetical protein C8R41DRAFT_772490 [Lentinula lateritia]
MVYSRDSGFVLLNIPNVQIRSQQSSYSESGTLTIECIYVTPEGQAAIDRNIFLILRINSNEIPLDPRRMITFTAQVQGAHGQTYVLHGTDLDPEVLEIYVPVFDSNDAKALQRQEDLDTLQGIFIEYAGLQELTSAHVSHSMPISTISPDLRSHLVLVNEDSGDIIGEVDQRVTVHEDPDISHLEKGHEHGPVVIEINQDEEGQAIEVFARAIPNGQEDWMTKSARLVSQGISQTTNLLINVVSSTSSNYINRSSPSTSTISGAKSSPSSSKAVAFISSSRTRSGLTHAHALTAQAVKVSGKTLSVIDDMIGKMIGTKSSSNTPKGMSKTSTVTLSSLKNVVNVPSPPPYSTSPNTLTDSVKPPLPPRKVPILSQSGSEKPPFPPPRFISTPDTAPPVSSSTLTTKAKLILSADLILSTLDESVKQLIDVGGRSATRVVGHQYGSEAAQNTALIAGTVRNVALVYIDMRGVGRKALIKRVGKQYVKSKFSKRDE